MTVPEPRRGGCPTRPAEQSSAVFASHSRMQVFPEPRRALLARPAGRVRGSCWSQGEGYNYLLWVLRPNYLMKPASVLLESTPEQLPKGPPSPTFLVDLPAWHTVFFRNLADLFRPDKQAQFKPSSAPGSFWPDVFVVSGAPWSRFALSLLGHVAAIAAIFGLVQLWPQKPEVVVSRVFNRNDVIYYAPSEYLPPLDTGGAKKPLPQKGEPAYAPQPIISVPPEADNRSQTIVTPSDVKLNHDIPLPNIVAWSQPQAQPAMPLASTTAAAQNLRLPTLSVAAVAPTPETIPTERQRSASLSQAVVAPAQELNVESSARTLQAPQAAVVAPTPQVDSTSARRLGDINIGHSAIVAPSPELPVAEQYAEPCLRSSAVRVGQRGTGCGTAASLNCRSYRLELRGEAHLAWYSSRRSGAGGTAGRQSPWNPRRDSNRQSRWRGHP